MVNLRRQRLKAIRSGCSVIVINKCSNQAEVLKVMKLNDKKKTEGLRGNIDLKEESEDGTSE